ncbi:MJ0042 family finger-like domain protein [Enhydrobacter aerosaccus SK60]|nr:MJ0042 family finger-like domain protein [Enhydrobacter aerosaccus SK60]
MNLYNAKCPNCQHAFKINDEQLAVKNGYVRCSYCKTMFSATEQLEQQKITNNNPPASPNHQTSSALIDDKSEEILFDDESGIDEAGNLIVDEPVKPISPYPLSQSHTKSAYAKSNSTIDDLEIIDNFDQLPIAKNSNPKVLIGDEDAVEAIDLAQDNETLGDEQAWLLSLMAQADDNEAADDTAGAKRGMDGVFNTDIFDQIPIDTRSEQQADLLAYQQKIDERLSQQVSSQQLANAKIFNMSIIWGLGSLLLIFLLAAQYIIFNINTLITSKTNAAVLSKICHKIPACQLPIADTGLIDVQMLALAPSSKQAGQTDVVFTLTNTTDNNIVYPSVQVSLRSGNTILAQTLLTPTDYLEAGNNYLMPHQIKPVKLRIDFPKTKVQAANIELIY